MWRLKIIKKGQNRDLQGLRDLAGLIFAYLQLGRIGMAPLTMSVPVLGGLSLTGPLPNHHLWGLALLGLCAHFFGFAFNDIIDYPLDRQAPGRQRSPLVSGQFSLKQAWGFTLVQVPAALVLYHLVAPGNYPGLGWLWLSIGLSIIYNLGSKWGRAPRFVAELALALSIGALCLAGALSTGPSLPWRSQVFILTLSLLMLLLNSVPSGLKDIKTDLAFGARSFVIAAGASITTTDKLMISKRLWVYSFSLQLLILAGLSYLVYLYQVPWWIGLGASLLWLYSGLNLRMILALPTFSLLHRSLPLLSGYYNYFALSLFVISAMPLYLQLVYSLSIGGLLLLPWYLGFYVWRKRYQVDW
jgi:4-hydroxybenzoate polyprenyltransferase